MSDRETLEVLRQAAAWFEPSPDGFGPLLDEIGDASLVLIGEASHGTHEFYRTRAELTRALILRKGFNLVAVEADWPDAYRANRWVRHTGSDPDAETAVGDFTRFPRWMWRNRDVVVFLDWLRGHNAALDAASRVGFYGLDLYSLHTSIEAVSAYARQASGGARAVVWAHNSHLGDARATEMGRRGELNLGQLVRQEYGTQARLIGFSTHTGTVTAASNWDEPAQRKRVRPSLAGSFERLFHDVGIGRFQLYLGAAAVRQVLTLPRLERAIGVIYRPESERGSHYFHAHLPQQFDAILHVDDTHALEPLERWSLGEADLPETYPSALQRPAMTAAAPVSPMWSAAKNR